MECVLEVALVVVGAAVLDSYEGKAKHPGGLCGGLEVQAKVLGG